MIGAAILLGVLWAACFWALVFSVPFALPLTAALSLVLTAAFGGGLPPTAAALFLAAALAAEGGSRALDRRFVRQGGGRALAAGGGLLLLSMVLGPVLGVSAWGAVVGAGGRSLASATRRLAVLAVSSRVLRGGVALGLAVWLFTVWFA